MVRKEVVSLTTTKQQNSEINAKHNGSFWSKRLLWLTKHLNNTYKYLSKIACMNIICGHWEEKFLKPTQLGDSQPILWLTYQKHVQRLAFIHLDVIPDYILTLSHLNDRHLFTTVTFTYTVHWLYSPNYIFTWLIWLTGVSSTTVTGTDTQPGRRTDDFSLTLLNTGLFKGWR